MPKVCRSCCVQTPCRTTSVTVNGCTKGTFVFWPVAGVTVQVLSGTTVISSGTTNSSGVATLGYYTTGSYTIKAIPPAVSWWKQTAVTQNVTLSCTTTSSWSLTLAAATGSSCYCVGCRDPLPPTATLTDANGTHTLNYTTNSPVVGWVGCYILPGGASHTWSGTGTCDPATGDTAIGYVLACNFVLYEYWCACEVVPPYSLIPGTCIGQGNLPQDTPTGGFKTSNISVVATNATTPNNCHDALSFAMTGAGINGTIAVSFP